MMTEQQGWRRGALVGLRLGGGIATLAAAAALVAGVLLVPLPTVGAVPGPVEVTPAPAELVRGCAGSVVRLSDSRGGEAGEPSPIGAPEVTATGVTGEAPTPPDVRQLADSPLPVGAAPLVVALPGGDGAMVAAAQGQQPAAPGYTGYLASACLEPDSSTWLVGGATTLGRTTLLSLVNPSAVDAEVALELWGEGGPISAPGTDGIAVPAGGQRMLSLAAFAPNAALPVVHVISRGGAVVATLQESVVRGLDDGGTEVVSPGAVPGTATVIPGVQLAAQRSTLALAGLEGWADIRPAVRIAVPGPAPAHVSVTVASDVAGLDASTFEVMVDAGAVVELPLDSGLGVEAGFSLPDGRYSVSLASDVPIVAGVRASTSGTTPAKLGVEQGAAVPDLDPGQAPASDLGWFASARPLGATTLLAVADGPQPLLVLANPTASAATVGVARVGGPSSDVEVAPGAVIAVPVRAATGYLLTGTEGLVASVAFSGAGQLSGYPIAPAHPLPPPVLVRP